jgi:hypothetical protein
MSPSSVEAKPHCGDRKIRSRSMFVASSMRRLSAPLDFERAVLLVTSPTSCSSAPACHYGTRYSPERVRELAHRRQGGKQRIPPVASGTVDRRGRSLDHPNASTIDHPQPTSGQ